MGWVLLRQGHSGSRRNHSASHSMKCGENSSQCLQARTHPEHKSETAPDPSGATPGRPGAYIHQSPGLYRGDSGPSRGKRTKVLGSRRYLPSNAYCRSSLPRLLAGSFGSTHTRPRRVGRRMPRKKCGFCWKLLTLVVAVKCLDALQLGMSGQTKRSLRRAGRRRRVAAPVAPKPGTPRGRVGKVSPFTTAASKQLVEAVSRKGVRVKVNLWAAATLHPEDDD